MDIVIITNSPGELSSWVKVTAEKLKLKAPGAKIVVMLVPCPYASGREKEIAGNLTGVDVVISPSEFLAFLFGFPLPRYTPSKKGVVAFLGGDFWHAVWASWRLKFPAVAYTVRATSWNKYFKFLCVADEKIKDLLLAKGVPAEKIKIVGNLMVEGVKPALNREDAFKKWNLDSSIPVVSIFPGSRLYHVKESLPVFLKVSEEIASAIPGIQFMLGLSPFVSLDDLKECLSSSENMGIKGRTGRIEVGENGKKILTEGGVLINLVQDSRYDLMNLSDLVLTIPGTNTAEIAFLERPMIVASTWRAKIPRGGMGGLIGNLPFCAPFKRKLMHTMLKKIKFTAIPNQVAQKEIVPEIRVEKDSMEIADVAVELLKDKDRRNKISLELKGIMGGNGAAEKMAEIILSVGKGEVQE
ncbi:MAG: hypothetical protein M1536_05865 [Firmicutes bacterium]|nr:hypothetical protein [Bacillota bacterium]